MKDYEANILKSFVFALAKQSSPLPDHIQLELNQIGSNPLENIKRLDEIANNSSTISKPYLDAYEWLDTMQERNKGIDFKPDASIEKQNSEIAPIENSSLFINLERIKDKAINDKTKQILQSADSVAAAQQFLY